MSPTAVSHLSARLLARRTARAVLIRLVPLLALVWIAAPAAEAGTYDVYWCKAPGGRNVPAEVVFGWNTVNIGADSNCGGPGGRIALSLGTDARQTGLYALADVTAPSSVKILSADIERTSQLTPGIPTPDGKLDYGATPAVDILSNTVGTWSDPTWTLLARCAFNGGGCPSEGIPDPKVSMWLGGTAALRFVVHCGGQSDKFCNAGTVSRVRTDITAIHLVLEDKESPSAKAVSGSILSAGIHRGAESALLSAADLGSGVFRASALLDGVPVGSTSPGGKCASAAAPGDSDFDLMLPCPTWGVQLEVPIDTTKVADGTRKLRITVADAAGNTQLVEERNIEIDNVPPPKAATPPVISGATFPNALRPGDKLAAKNGTWTGTGLSFSYRWQRYDAADQWVDIAGATSDSYVVAKADVDRKLRVVATARNSEGSVEAASAASGVVQSGATVSVASLAPGVTHSDPSSPQLVLDREQRSVQVRYGAKIVVTGRLVDADAAPIADAEVDVFEQVSVVGAPWRKVTTIKTDSQGGYVYRPATTGGRVLRFAYASKRDTGDYRATREVVIAVTAGMEIKAVRRSIPAQGVIRLRGRVLAEPLPAAGTWVEIQVLDAGVWRTVGTRRTSATGRWSYKHRVRRTSNATFTFRARLRQMSDVPAIESKSASVKVHVR